MTLKLWTFTGEGMPFLAAALSAPLIGITTDAPDVAHQVTLEQVVKRMPEWETAKGLDALCGAFVKLMAPTYDNGHAVLSWKALRTRGTTITRCPACLHLLSDARTARTAARAERRLHDVDL